MSQNVSLILSILTHTCMISSPPPPLQMASMTELHENQNMPLYDITEFDPLLDSSDMDPSDWVKIADSIEQNCKQYTVYVYV